MDPCLNTVARMLCAWGLLFGTAVAAAPKLAAPGLQGVQVSEELTAFYSDHLARLLEVEGVGVMSASDIRAMLGLERQKQLLGCEEQASCVAELANALGVDGLLTGSIGRFGDRHQINLKVVAAGDGRQLAIYSGSASTESEMLPALKVAAASLSAQLDPGAVAKKRPLAGARRWSWVPLVASALGAGLGVGMFAMASDRAQALRGIGTMPSTLTMAQASAAYADGSTFRTVGIVSFPVAAVALATAVVIWLFGAPVPTTGSSAAGPGSGGDPLAFGAPW